MFYLINGDVMNLFVALMYDRLVNRIMSSLQQVYLKKWSFVSNKRFNDQKQKKLGLSKTNLMVCN